MNVVREVSKRVVQVNPEHRAAKRRAREVDPPDVGRNRSISCLALPVHP